MKVVEVVATSGGGGGGDGGGGGGEKRLCRNAKRAQTDHEHFLFRYSCIDFLLKRFCERQSAIYKRSIS
ncbi:hypothetical protein Tco_1004249 [Tanacetum coccineum]|uniref:Uncharacterized protein n=1 Tax=Tanacetum coccineum TaxID=301880 RepID=A0ABQ5FBR3_9ASTR